MTFFGELPNLRYLNKNVFFEFRKNGQLQGQYTQGQNITILIYAVALDI